MISNDHFMTSLRKSMILTAVEYVKNDLIREIKNKKLPEGIIDAISISAATGDNTKSVVSVIIDTSKAGAEMAAAFEFGSGLYATRGKKEKYEIGSKSGNRLAIPLVKTANSGGWPKFDAAKWPPGVVRGGKAITTKGFAVHHPGVAPRPYIRPTLKAGRNRLARALRRTVNESFKTDITVIKAEVIL
jgi:hypothetical protein